MRRRPLKKLEESDDDADPSFSAPAVDEDALMASLSGFLVPDAFSSLGGSQQPTQPIADHMYDQDDRQTEDRDDDGFDPVHKPNRDHDGSSTGAAAAASAGKQAPAKRKRKRKGDDALTAEEASAERAAQAAAAAAGDVEAAAHRAAVAKARQLRRETPSTARLRHVASTGLVHSSLPLLSALVRERLLENSLPAAARALAQLYPAFRLDIDTVCNCTLEIMAKHTQQQVHAHGGQQAANNQITRFYKKIINLHPNNLLQVVFELAFQFLRHGASQEAYDHLATWSVSPFLASTASRSSAASLQLLHGYIGVIAWECARQAREEGARWAALLQRREDGDDDGVDAEPRGAAATASASSSRLSLHDLRLEVRTCSAKQLSFEKLARSKLRAAVNADRPNGLWLFYYLQCMQQFYSELVQQHSDSAHASSSSAAAAAASSSSAVKSRVQLDQAKLAHLQQRLIRKIDDFIIADAASPTSAGQSAASGFHLRLQYLHLFLPHARSTQERQHAWLTVAHLLRADPLSNLGIAHAWRLWEEQGQRDATTAASSSSASVSRWCIRSADLIDVFAARLDSYPTEEWSWHALLRLMATHLHIDAQASALWRWKFNGVLEPAAADTAHPQTPSVAPASPASSSVSASPLQRSVSRQSDASSERGGRRVDLGGGGGDGSDSDSASPSPVKKPRTTAAAAANADADDESGSASSTPLMHTHATPASPASQGSGSTGRAQRSFPHMQLESLPALSDSERKSSLWLGRIEWWVQATGYWRDVPHIHPHDAPPSLPAAPAARLLLLRGVCYWLTLHWMGWVSE